MTTVGYPESFQKNQYAAEDEIRRMIIDRIKEIALEFEDR